MAFMEGKLQPIDLIAALQARRQMQQTAEQQKQQQLQNELLQEQVKAAEWENLKAREVPTMTVPSSGLTGMPTKKFLHEMPGYISGVDPTTVFNQWNQNFRQGMTAGGGGYGGRGGGDASAQQGPTTVDEGGGKVTVTAGPLSYYGPDKTQAPDSVTAANLLAQLYGRGGSSSMSQPDLSNPNELANALNTEQENIGGMQSLISQAAGRGKDLSGSDLTSGMTPVGDAVNKQVDDLNSQYNTWMNSGSTVPPKDWPQAMREAGAREKTKLKDNTSAQQKKEMDSYYNKLYSSPQFKNTKNLEDKKKMENEYGKYIKWALETKRRPNLPSFFDMFGIVVE